MTQASLCAMPLKPKGEDEDLGFDFFVDRPLVDYVNQVKPYHLEIESTSKCPGSCAYCYSSSLSHSDQVLPTERVLQLIDEAKELGIQLINWLGGDPLYHPDWYRMMSYGAEKGLTQGFCTSGLISRRTAQQIAHLKDCFRLIAVHIDSIVPETYNRVHFDGSTLEKKVRGYRYLLDAGIPPEQISGIITMTRAAAETVEETVDWFVDRMGSQSIVYVMFKGEGFGGENESWEPPVSEMRRACEYRAKKLGPHWLRLGTSEVTMFYCRTMFNVNYQGQVLSCPVMRDRIMGNIFEENLKEIFERNRDSLLFNFQIKGPCATCQNNDLCFGCRATAYHYLGDVEASDPKCWLNPESLGEYVLRR